MPSFWTAAPMACRCLKRCARVSTAWRAISISRRWSDGVVGANPVGVIGLGLMGEVYVGRLVAAGWRVTGFDVDAAKSERLAQPQARAGTLAGIARDCDPIVVAVFNTDQVEDVVERTLVPAAAGKIVIC